MKELAKRTLINLITGAAIALLIGVLFLFAVSCAGDGVNQDENPIVNRGDYGHKR